MAVAVRVETEQTQRPVLVVSDRRPYRCGGKRNDIDGRGRDCHRRMGDIEGTHTLLVTCERCGQEHEFALQTERERDLEARIVTLLALVAYLSYDGDAAP